MIKCTTPKFNSEPRNVTLSFLTDDALQFDTNFLYKANPVIVGAFKKFHSIFR